MEVYTSLPGLSHSKGRKQETLGLLPSLLKVEKQRSREKKKKIEAQSHPKRRHLMLGRWGSVGVGPPEPGCGPDSRENNELGEPELQPLGTRNVAIPGLVSRMCPWCALAWKHALPQPARPGVPFLRCPDFCWTDLGQ